MKIPKLLSPIKSFEGAKRVVDAGADEIYCGVRNPGMKGFELYRGPLSEIPSYEDLEKVVKYAHEHDVKVFLTVNIPFMTDVIDDAMRNHVRLCLERDVDALIIGDMGILSMVKELGVKVPLYASSYLEATNYEAIEFLKKQGFNRVVLERQLTIHEIAEIVKRSDIDIEIFVHGSGCSNINGNCYIYHNKFPEINKAMSKIVSFKLPCRICFDIHEINGGKIVDDLPILDAYTFCSICHLPELIDTGVVGFKIVGRSVHAVYQEKTTRLYRELLDLLEQEKLETFHARVEVLKKEFMPIAPNLPSLQDACCAEERCYYGSFFNTPYTRPPSLSLWTKMKFVAMMNEDESNYSSREYPRP
jgi:putative protease